MKIRLSDALAICGVPRDTALDRALAPDATIEDVARAGLLVRKLTTFWIQHADPADRPRIEAVEQEYLAALSLRLMEIDEGDDLTAAAIAASVLRPGQ
jgi:hypothetical protein